MEEIQSRILFDDIDSGFGYLRELKCYTPSILMAFIFTIHVVLQFLSHVPREVDISRISKLFVRDEYLKY